MKTLVLLVVAVGLLIVACAAFMTMRSVDSSPGPRLEATTIWRNRVIALTLAVFAVLSLAQWYLADTISSFLAIIGALVFFLSASLYAKATRHLRGTFSATENLRLDHRLVTSGPYAWSRNPVYLAYVGMVFAIFLVTQNYLFIGIAVIHIFYLLRRIPKEEALLRTHFGADYDNYHKATPKFFKLDWL
jgi:protein-S-isoprenylcysteine O-methyltransferase Ste14